VEDDKENMSATEEVEDDDKEDDDKEDDDKEDDDKENVDDVEDKENISDTDILIRYTIKLYEPWFEWILTGDAGVICARGTLDTFGSYVNSGVMIINGNDDNERTVAKITAVNFYHTLHACVETEGYASISPVAKSTDDCMKLYADIKIKGKELYSEPLVKAFGGICALKVELI
jgi:hypothetical protein